MRRFYKDVRVSADRGLLLDGKPVRTPKRAPLVAPTDALVAAIADEWRGQGEKVDPRTMPLTGLANAAIDIVAPDPAASARGLAAYGESDLLCYRAADPPDLVARQDEQWNPLLAWARARYDVSFTVVTGIIHQPQPSETVARLGQALDAFGFWHLAPLNPIITISGSLILALALAEAHIEPETAFDIAHLDELWQAEKWGEDHFAMQTRDAHRADFLQAARFLALLD
ncbi:MAG: ATP12 family chaperone protein [Sphingomonadaceae bacterium]